jgi:hypothetical protein
MSSRLLIEQPRRARYCDRYVGLDVREGTAVRAPTGTAYIVVADLYLIVDTGSTSRLPLPGPSLFPTFPGTCFFLEIIPRNITDLCTLYTTSGFA